MSTESGNRENADEAAIRAILARVEECVHKLDYEGVRDFIPNDGLYFGSVASVAHGYDQLFERQFTKVWPNISDFSIPANSIAIHVAKPLAWATCTFESGGTDPDGNAIQRSGRMTFVFECREEQWVMVHSHDSLTPSLA